MEDIHTMKTNAHDQTDISKLTMVQTQFSPAFNGNPISPEAELIAPPPASSPASHMSFHEVVAGNVVRGRAAAAAEAVAYFSGPGKSMEAMREMIFRIAAMQPITPIDPEAVKAPKRRNVKISKDPQSVAARQRRERISEKIRILQRLVPGGTKMDTASMLEEAVHYVKFLKKEVENLEQASVLINNIRPPPALLPLGGGLGGGGCVNYRSWSNNLRPSRITG